MKYYLAGPMRGIPDGNFPLFDRVAHYLRVQGEEIVSPAEHDREVYGSHDEAAEHLKDIILWDLAAVAECDGLILLPGWEKSYGCAVEYALARFLGLEIWHFDVEKLDAVPAS